MRLCASVLLTFALAFCVGIVSVSITLPPAPPTAAHSAFPSASFSRQVLAPHVEVSNDANGGGSGVCISVADQLFILTNYHVVAANRTQTEVKKFDAIGAEYIEVVNTFKPLHIVKIVDGNRHECLAEVVAFSLPFDKEGFDLALLRPTDAPWLTPAKLMRTPVLVGEDCWYVGAPHMLHRSLERSIINDPAAAGLGCKVTIVNGNGYFGSSGGGVYVRRGSDYILVGLITGMIGNSPKAPMFTSTQSQILTFLRTNVE